MRRINLRPCLAILGILLLTACSAADNRSLSLKKYQGRWVYVNYWATWCKPCIDEMPALEAFYQTHQSKGVMVIGVSFDKLPAADITKTAKQLAINYPLVSGLQSPPWSLDAIAGLPVTYIVNPKGQLQEALFGPQTADSLAKSFQQVSDDMP